MQTDLLDLGILTPNHSVPGLWALHSPLGSRKYNETHDVAFSSLHPR